MSDRRRARPTASAVSEKLKPNQPEIDPLDQEAQALVLGGPMRPMGFGGEGILNPFAATFAILRGMSMVGSALVHGPKKPGGNEFG